MALINRGYVIGKDGKIKKSAPKMNVSKRIKIARSKTKRFTSRAKAAATRGFKP